MLASLANSYLPLLARNPEHIVAEAGMEGSGARKALTGYECQEVGGIL